MKKEILTLEQNDTWEQHPLEKKAARCQWVYPLKLNPDGSFARLKACLVAKRYSQVLGMDYQHTQPVAKLTSMQILVSLVVTPYWPLHQMDIKKAFLNDVLDEKVYMK